MTLLAICTACKKDIVSDNTDGWIFYLQIGKMIGGMYAHKECFTWKDYQDFMDDYGPLVHHVDLNHRLFMDVGGADYEARRYQKFTFDRMMGKYENQNDEARKLTEEINRLKNMIENITIRYKCLTDTEIQRSTEMDKDRL